MNVWELKGHIIFRKWHFYGIPLFKCRPVNLCDLLGFIIFSQIIWQGHITDLGHFYNYSHILVVDSSTTNIN
jgi:hypothetical protein